MASDKTVMAVIRAARPTFRNQNDKIAFAVHASFLASGYILTATGPQALSDTAFSNPSNGKSPFFFNYFLFFFIFRFFAEFLDFLFYAAFLCVDEVSIDHWNELNDEYAFVYANPEKGSKKVIVKCLVMNDKLLVDALSEGSSEPVHLEIR